MAQTVGFIGLGAMGNPIAKHLVADGPTSLKIFNRTTEKVHAFKETLHVDVQVKVHSASSAATCAPSADGIVFSIVDKDESLEQIVAGPEGLLAGLGPGGVHVCLSTVSPATSERMAALHAAKGVAYVACPVFGRPEAAAARKLIAVPAGPAEAVERVEPYLRLFAHKVVNAGPNPASASILKLCGNFMILSALETCGEAFALAESHGVQRSVAYDLLAGPEGLFSTVPVFQNYGRMVANRTFEPVGFTAVNGFKDARLVCEAAASGGLAMPVAELVRSRLEGVVAHPGGGAQDWATFTADIKPGNKQGEAVGNKRL